MVLKSEAIFEGSGNRLRNFRKPPAAPPEGGRGLSAFFDKKLAGPFQSRWQKIICVGGRWGVGRPVVTQWFVEQTGRELVSMADYNKWCQGHTPDTRSGRYFADQPKVYLLNLRRRARAKKVKRVVPMTVSTTARSWIHSPETLRNPELILKGNKFWRA